MTGCSVLTRPSSISGKPVTASIGVVQYYLQESVAGLIERADKALYRAKQNGRNRMELAP